jgi:hypothetical protein
MCPIDNPEDRGKVDKSEMVAIDISEVSNSSLLFVCAERRVKGPVGTEASSCAFEEGPAMEAGENLQDHTGGQAAAMGKEKGGKRRESRSKGSADDVNLAFCSLYTLVSRSV